jgi:SAM-dependent methyltransferase
VGVREGGIVTTGRWWKNREEPEGTTDDLERVAEINARAPVPIEVPGTPLPRAADGGAARVDEAILREEHHHQYGGPWAKGKYRFEFLVESGLRPEHRLLDIGCGSLRIGVPAIRYLEAGNYCGVESHLYSLEAAATYEVPLHGLEAKRPRLLWDADFTFSHFGTTFDWVIDSATSTSVGKHPERQELLFRNLAEVLKPGGRLLIVPRPVVALEQLRDWGLAIVRENVVQHCPLLAGHEDDFKSVNTWYEFERV